MKYFKKALTLCLALSLICSVVLTGCDKPVQTASSQPTGKSGSNSLAPETKVDMKGYQFVMASAWMRAVISKNPTEAESLLFQRIDRVEKEYNCKITIKSVYADPATMLPKILAGDKVADVVEMMPSMWIPAISSGYIVPWDNVKGISINDSRWVSAYTQTAAYDGKHWGLQFSTPPEVRTCIYYNKDLLKANGITEDPADLVNSGKWTFDKFREMSKACTKDTNNDGKIETYGVLSMDPQQTGIALVEANNGRLCTQQAGGTVKATFTSQNVIDALNFYDQLVNQDKVVKVWDYMTSESTWNSPVTSDDIFNFFRSGNAAFLVCDSWVGNQQLKPFADKIHYGMLPLPKGPAATDYTSPAQYSRVFTITSTNKDAEKSAIIFNALAYPPKGYEGDSWWLDDIQKDYFQDDDTKSVNMYNLCLNKSSVDLGVGVQKLFFDFNITAITSSVYWHDGTPASEVNGMAGSYDDAVKAVFTVKK